MATNFGIKIDLLKLKGAFMRNLKGQTATKRCLIIPVDECDGIFLGEKRLLPEPDSNRNAKPTVQRHSLYQT